MSTSPMSTTQTARHGGIGVAGLLALASIVAGGCRGERSDKPPHQFFPDLDDQPKWRTQSKSEFYEDGRIMRHVVPGTVAFGQNAMTTDDLENADWAQRRAADREIYLQDDTVYFTGLADASKPDSFVDTLPARVVVDDALLARGRERFDIYCSACHGYAGDGQGMVGRQWAYPVPNFHDPKYSDKTQKTGKDGYIFSTSRHGVENGAKMPGYAHALSISDSWAIVAWIRVLQENRTTTPITPAAAPANPAASTTTNSTMNPTTTGGRS